MRVLAIVCSAIVILGAWGISASQASSSNAPRSDDYFSRIPSRMLSKANPYAGKEDAVLAGKKLFRQHCGQCHGLNSHGLGRAADLHAPQIQDAPPGVLFWIIRNGRLRKDMPSWAQLPDPQIWQLVTYLKTLQ